MPDPTPDLSARPTPPRPGTETRGADPTPDLSADPATVDPRRSARRPGRARPSRPGADPPVAAAGRRRDPARGGRVRRDDAGAGAVRQRRLRRLPRAGPHRRPQQPVPTTTQRAQREITRLEQTKADLQSSSEARQAALTEARKQADTLDILAGTVPVTGPGIRVTIDETDGAVEHRLAARHGPGAARRRRGVDAVQRPGARGRLHVVRGRRRRASTSTTCCSSRRTCSTRSASRRTLHGAMVFREGPIEQLENDGATVDRRRAPVARHQERDHAGGTRSSLQPVTPE